MTDQQIEVRAILVDIDGSTKAPALWQLSELMLEAGATAMQLQSGDQRENTDLHELETVLGRIVRANEAEDQRHQKIIRLCRAAQLLCRDLAHERGQTGRNGKSKEPSGLATAQ